VYIHVSKCKNDKIKEKRKKKNLEEIPSQRCTNHNKETQKYGKARQHDSGKVQAMCWWLTPIILASWEAEIGRIMVPG
jgi:hypothetical protein